MTASSNNRPRSSYSRRLAAEQERSPPSVTAAVQTDAAFLADHAERIKTLLKRARNDIFEIGRLLVEAKERCDHGDWLPWLSEQFEWGGRWGERTAQRFMSVYKLSLEYDNLSDLDLSDSSLYVLAAPRTSTGARAEVVDRARNGERLRFNDVYDIVEQHRRPAPMGSRYSPCNMDHEAEPPDDPSYPDTPEWPFNIDVAEYQVNDARRQTEDFGLFRPGTRTSDFTEEWAAKVREVANAWGELAKRIDAARQAEGQDWNPAQPLPDEYASDILMDRAERAAALARYDGVDPPRFWPVCEECERVAQAWTDLAQRLRRLLDAAPAAEVTEPPPAPRARRRA
jgi:hypothetical protein